MEKQVRSLRSKADCWIPVRVRDQAEASRDELLTRETAWEQGGPMHSQVDWRGAALT